MSSLPPSALVRRMTPADLDRVMEIAESLKDAPQWPRCAYLAALETEAAPPRIALVVELLVRRPETGVLSEENTSGAKAPAGSIVFMPGINPRPTARLSFSAACAEGDSVLDPEGKQCDIESHPSDKNKSVARVGHPESMGQSSKVVGFAVASLLPPEAELEMIAVAPTAQRRGLARQIFFSLAAELRTAEVFGIMLEVRAANQPALELYRRLGFVETGHRPRYYHDPVEDAILMRLRL